MGAHQLVVAGAGLFCLVIFLSGFRLSRSGKPYNGALFNIHKLIALAAAVLFALVLIRTDRAGGLGAGALAAGVVAGLLLIALFVTGGLLSVEKPAPAIVKRLHHVMPYLAVLAVAVTLVLLLSLRS